MSQKPQQDGMPNAEAVDLPEISVEYSTEFLTGSAPCAGVSRPLPAAWLGQRGIYRSRFEAVCNGEQLVEPLTLGELIQRAWPSPSTELAERGTQHRFSTTEQTCRHDFAGVWWNDNGVTQTGHECRHCGFFVADVTEAPAEQAEAERPEVVAYADPIAFATFKKRGHEGGVVGREWMWAKPGAGLVAMSRTDECECIVGSLRAKADQLSEALEWRKENQAGQRELLRSVTAERDAALAEVEADRDLVKIMQEQIDALRSSEEVALARVADLETALAPFAAVADAYDDSEDDDHEPYTDMGCDDRLRLTLGQHRAAQTALSGAPSPAQAEQAEVERPEQPKRYTADVFYHNHFSTVQMEVVRASDFDEFAAQHERIVGALTRDHAHVEEHLSRQIDILRINLAAKRINLAAALARCAELKAELAMANDAAAKGDAARHQCAGMEMEIKELRGAADHWEAESRALQKQRDAALAKLAELEKQEKQKSEWVRRAEELGERCDAARARGAEMEKPEPVAWLYRGTDMGDQLTFLRLDHYWRPKYSIEEHDYIKGVPLYAAPVAKAAEIERLDRVAASQGGPSDA
ncbi:hypothetical protein [Pseudomonas aeruginosa]|uniref:hypothetical protein n=1 Tax=Pseudomonas aeruginosa TaxID=287 RepID=UPI00292BF04D|nr:hypothetical protein [Pseudomonas aeruginosa]HEC1421676.1 hypothetical protein [Pseudomonas aeruginosa]